MTSLKHIFANKIIPICYHDNFFKLLCGLVVLTSIALRSIADIGPDSSVYLDVGKKIAEGKTYFKDIFEINFPIMMWLYALLYKIALIVNIHPIILTELVINLGGLLSIYWSAKILRATLAVEDKNLYKLIILSFFLGFFLRPYSLHMLEYGTKTSFFLWLFYPYFAYCLINPQKLGRRRMIIKGILMAMIVALKPHYLIFVVAIEIYLAFKHRNYFLLIGFDKLCATAIYLCYVLAIFHYTPLFIEMVVPMWSNYFKTYKNLDKLLTNIYSNMAFVIYPYVAVFLVFTRVRMTEIDKIFLTIFMASAMVILLENIFTIDQFSLFCGLNLPFMLRIFQIIIRNNFLNFADNLFFLGFFIIIPLSQTEFIRITIFGYSGVFNMWWVMLIYSLIIMYRKPTLVERNQIFKARNIIIFAICYLICFAFTIYGFRGANFWLSNFIGLTSFFIFYFIAEKYWFPKLNYQLSRFSIFIVMASLFLYLHDYSDSLRNFVSEDGYRNKFRKIYDFKAYYYKKFAPQPHNHEIDFFGLHQLPHPLASYFNKDMPQKMSIFSMNANHSSKRMMFYNRDPQSSLVYGYMIDDLKKMLADKNTQLIFVDNLRINEVEANKCIVGYLEYVFFDKELTQLFLQNYRFENRLIVTKNYQINDDFFNNLFTDSNNGDNYKTKYRITGNFQKIISDIEVYVRKN